MMERSTIMMPRTRSSNTMTESNSTQAASHPESSQNQSQIQEPIEVENAEILEIIDVEGRVKRKRGIQHAKDVWNLQAGERIVIKCNRFGQPLKKGGGILSGWLGLVARMGNWCPIGYKSWKIVPSRYKIDLLNLTRSKFVLPNSDADKWVLKYLSRKWKNFRFELKAKYMLEDLTEPQLASNVPHGIVPHQWVDLVRYWFSEKCQVYSQIGKASRSLHTTHHTTGSRSFARKRDEFEIEHGREPSRFEFFIETHKRKDGTFDKPSQTIVDNVATKIVEKGGTSESSEATSHLQDEAYTDILGKDRYGHVRGYGIGVTPTQLFGVEAYIRKMGCGGVDSMEMQRFKDQMKSTLKAHEEQMQTMQIKYESQIQTMQKNHEVQMEAMHNSCEAKLAGIQSQLDQVTFMLLGFSGSFNNPIAGLAHFGSNIHQVNPSSSNDERDIL